MKLKHWTIGTKLWALSSFLMLNMVLMGLIEMMTSRALLTQVHDIANTQLPAIRHMTMIDTRREGLRSVVLTGLRAASAGAIDRCLEAKEEVGQFSEVVNEHLNALAALSLKPETRKPVEEIRSALRAYSNLAGEMLGAASKPEADSSTAARIDFPRFHESYQVLESQIGLLCERITADAQEATQLAEKLAAQASFENMTLLTCGLGAGILASLFVVRGLVSGLRGVLKVLSGEASQVLNGASRIHLASDGLSQATVQQAAALDQTVASMEEMAAMLGKTADNAGRSHSVAAQGEEEALKGKQVIARLLKAMEEIEGSNAKLGRIVQLIHEIGDKTRIINDIVFETRLLSFNASIEAARAGIHGKGFAAVAEEVGKLASLSGRAADEIRRLLDSSTTEVTEVARETQERVSAGRHAFMNCAETFTGMEKTLSRIRDSAQQIATATREQEISVKQTNKAMSAIDQVTAGNSRQAESLSGLAVELSNGAASLHDSVATLRRMVHGIQESPAEAQPVGAEGRLGRLRA